MKLSVIIPVYGVEDYLRKCIDSILKQDCDDFEIILVDDGSPDASPQICDEYAAAHENIRVVHRVNGGLSAARNSGIEVAIGEYLMFVDSDDYIEPNVLGGLISQVKSEELDVLRYDYQNVRLLTENGRMSRDKSLNEPLSLNDVRYEVFEPNKQTHKADKNLEIVDGTTYLNTRMGYGCYAWQFLIRKNLIIDDRCIDDRCFFTEGIHFEDVDWLPRMMLKAKRVNSTTRIVYDYLHRQGSITKTQGNKDKIKKNVEDEMLIIGKYKEHIDEYPNCQWLRKMQCSMVVGVLATIASELYSERKDYLCRLRELKVYPLVLADQGKTYSRRVKLINLIGARGYCLVMHMMTKVRAK